MTWTESFQNVDSATLFQSRKHVAVAVNQRGFFGALKVTSLVRHVVLMDGK